MTSVGPDRLQMAVSQIAREVESRINRGDQEMVDERQLWREMSCCILSSQVPYSMAAAAADRLDGSGLLRNTVSGGRESIQSGILELLLMPMKVEGRMRRYRFPNARSRQIAGAWETVRQSYGTLSRLLADQCDLSQSRTYLVQHIPGVGPKQASMFLRNVGATHDMAVIDRHVLQYMRIAGVGGDQSVDVGGLPAYERLESRLRSHAHGFGYTVGVFDWAIWIVMRAAAAMEPAWAS